MSHFEVRHYDAAGRLGELTVPRRGVTVETPALLPVVNPHVQTVSPATLESEFGAEILITNSYVLHGSDDLREPALEQGLHDLLEFSGAIMTDSGSFQLAEYGDITVTTEEILQFQHDIGSDIGTPVDIPTPPDVEREQAEEELATTQERLELAETVDVGEMLVTAPVQGSTYPDLREAAAEHADGTSLDVFPLGAVVPLMNEYRYADLVDVVAACKRGLGENRPVHLFGAGHPMMFALAVALGCDLFDSAAYALYARDGRYLTVRGTEHLDDMEYFPCHCPVCAEYTPEALRGMTDRETEELLARHNLHVTYGEIRTIKQAIRDGDLLELVESRARAHPDMLDGYRTLLDHADQLEETDPVSKDTFFYLSTESARRPEVVRHHRRLDRFDLSGDVFVTEGSRSDEFDENWRIAAPFGPYPRELSETYPFTAEVPENLEPQAYEAAADGLARLVELNPDAAFTLGHDRWPASALDRVPDRVDVRNLAERRDENPSG
ncbi:archaeosine tRNA-ribosyltransferase [Halomicrobium zhouii]|uniref:tRNA-guanine(15) transglycosylase n=1 Tax=Halomicrobium zhouii TaxID=767519 RepID=A0A1I6KGU6_9EURY|nr:tRNA guanosine(15) transglycosylase TgtA [Halomicrobium zhouii]SFR90416.1 archaeosine tRNA-ribosyltransferase [Halomicrobium zhouii]